MFHSLRDATPPFALLNDTNPTKVQKMMRHQHYATVEIYVEEVKRLLEGGGCSHADADGEMWNNASNHSDQHKTIHAAQQRQSV